MDGIVEVLLKKGEVLTAAEVWLTNTPLWADR
jgi:hypothetical protein